MPSFEDATPRADGPTLLRVDASMRVEGSATRALADAFLARFESGAAARGLVASVTRRDLAAEPTPPIDAGWIEANFTPAEQRTPAQSARLALSDGLIAELRAADLLLLAAPIYNFGPPAALKAWIDQVARARETFRYTEQGPVGLLTGKRAVAFVASGGTEVDGPIDFMTPYLRHALGFIGIGDVTVVAASRQMADASARDAAIRSAEAAAERLLGALDGRSVA